MPVAVLTVLKFCLLAGIFLFLARVLRAVWVEIGAPLDPGSTPAARVAGAVPGGSQSEGREGRRSRKRSTGPSIRVLRVADPVEQRGTTHTLTEELTIGRAPGCAIVVNDSFASQLHARVFQRDDDWFVEDLGSRNGTFLNRSAVHGPVKLHDGDRLKVGDTVFEVGTES